MGNNMTPDKIYKTLLLVGLSIVSLDSEKIVGKLENESMVFVYYNISKVVERPVLHINREHGMPVLGTGKEFYYTDEKSLVNLVLSIRK